MTLDLAYPIASYKAVYNFSTGKTQKIIMAGFHQNLANNLISQYYFLDPLCISLKANSAEKVFFSTNGFLPWEILLIKKLEIEQTKTTLYTTFKTVVALVFLISNL